jgi:hypothetical protein
MPDVNVSTDIDAFLKTANDAAARAELGVDASGTDNSTDVTLTGEDYLGLTGQQITANAIDLDNLSATGTADNTTFLRGDNTWAAPAGGGGGGGTVQNVNLSIEPTDDGTVAGNARGANAVDLQTSRTLATQVASASYSVVGGGYKNTAGSDASTVSGGYGNTAGDGFNGYCTVSGGYGNTATDPNNLMFGAISILGGYSNTASAAYATCVGGHVNTASGYSSFVGGGNTNTASSYFSTVGGGKGNTASGSYSTVSGGYVNTASGFYGLVSGGHGNTASGVYYSTVGGGAFNAASGDYATVCGGDINTASGTYSAILGGQSNNTNSQSQAMIVGNNITADRANCTFVNNLSIKDIPTAATGLPAGSVWNDGGTLKIV